MGGLGWLVLLGLVLYDLVNHSWCSSCSLRIKVFYFSLTLVLSCLYLVIVVYGVLCIVVFLTQSILYFDGLLQQLYLIDFI